MRGVRAGLDVPTNYPPWIAASFSGMLGVDAVYQGALAFLLAVAPAAPRAIGW